MTNDTRSYYVVRLFTNQGMALGYWNTIAGVVKALNRASRYSSLFAAEVDWRERRRKFARTEIWSLRAAQDAEREGELA